MTDVTMNATDKDFLQSIVDHPFSTLHSDDNYQLILSLIENLRSPDPILRDELSYTILEYMLGRQPVCSSEQYEQILQIVTDENHLFFNIGEVNTDSIFIRSFSILIVAAILEADRNKGYLNANTIRETIHLVINYALKEKDYRGYVEQKGWAHVVAHTADALDSCAQNPSASVYDRMKIMDTIADLVTLTDPLYHLECDRLAYPAYRMIANHQVDETYLDKWIRSFLLTDMPQPAGTIVHMNIQNFLRSLYFLLQWNQPDNHCLEKISHMLKELNIYYRYGFLS